MSAQLVWSRVGLVGFQSVRRWRHAGKILKYPNEIRLVRISNLKCNFFDHQVSRAQQDHCLFHSVLRDVGACRAALLISKSPREYGEASGAQACQLRDFNVGRIVRGNVFQRGRGALSTSAGWSEWQQLSNRLVGRKIDLPVVLRFAWNGALFELAGNHGKQSVQVLVFVRKNDEIPGFAAHRHAGGATVVDVGDYDDGEGRMFGFYIFYVE